MADVTLTLTTNENQAVKGIQNVQKAAVNLDKQMKDLFEANKKGFSSIEGIATYEKKMGDLKKKFTEVTVEEKKLTDSSKETGKGLEKIGDGSGKAGNSLGSLVVKLGLATVALQFLQKILQGVVTAFKDTAAGMNLATRASVIWKTTMYELAQGGKGVATTFKEQAKIADAINKARALENSNLIKGSKLQTDLTDLLYKAANASLSYKDKIVLLTEAQKVEDEIRKDGLITANAALAANQLYLDKMPESLSLQAKKRDLLIEIDRLESQANKRIETQVTMAAKQEREKAKQKWFEEIEARLKAQDEFQALSLKLAEEHDKAQIDLLEGNDKLAAQRDFDLKELAEFKGQMEKLGKLSEEQKHQFAIWGANIWMAFYNGWKEEAEKPLPQKDIDVISKALIGESDIIRKDLKKEREKIKKDLAANAAMEEFSIWKLLGIDTDSDEGQKQIDAIKELASTITGILEDSLDQRVEIAERERELLDTRIGELQNEIDLEAELMEEGYANNLDAKKKELEGLKKQREQALKEEEEALKRQRAFERISQGVSLASSVANILKEFTALGPLGLGLAAVAIGALFTIWQAAKTKAAESTALAEGGSGSETGMITGRRHSQGGERFLDHVEVERGEAWGVLSAPASEKYGKVFHHMVSSFNKNEMPDIVSSPIIHNPVTVENSGPNSRLDKVIKINEALLKQSHQYNVGNKRIIRSGNKVRIVG